MAWRALVCMVAAATPSFATADDDRGRARALGEEGIILYRNGELEAALARFNQAEAIFEAPTLALRAARCLERLGQWVAASKRYERAVSMSIDESLTTEFQEAQRAAQASAEAERRSLLERIPTLTIRVRGKEPDEMRLDDELLAPGAGDRVIRVDPGRHAVVATLGDIVDRHELTLSERDAVVLPIELKVPEKAPLAPVEVRPAGQPTADGGSDAAFLIAGVSLLSSAGVASIIGVGAWIVAADAGNELDERCPDRVCDVRSLGPEGEAALDRQSDAKTAMIASLSTAGALAAAGAIVLAVKPARDRAPAPIAVSLSPVGLRLSGEF